jgi:hypothetical protein
VKAKNHESSAIGLNVYDTINDAPLDFISFCVLIGLATWIWAAILVAGFVYWLFKRKIS